MTFKKQIAKLALTTAAFTVGTAIYSNLPKVQAMPTTSESERVTGLYSRDAASNSLGIYISGVTDKVFGMDAHDFDFRVQPEPPLAIDAVHGFQAAWATGDEKKILVAFVNATMFGRLTPTDAADMTYLCNEIDYKARANVKACTGVKARDLFEVLPPMGQEDGASGVSRRFWRWAWIRSKANISSNFGMQVLAGVLGNTISQNMPTVPRSWCVDGHGPEGYSSIACISWSAVATFTNKYAAEMVQDAIDSNDLNQFSVKADNAIGGKKRDGVSVCFSNRATGC